MKRSALQTLKARFSDRQVVTDPTELITYEIDAGFDRGHPDALVFPHSSDDVVRLVRWASEYDVPLIARGAGTGVAGGAVATQGGVIVVFAHMHRILTLNERSRTALVEPGVTNLDLDRRARAHSLYYPPDPSSQSASTIGGNVATNAGGPHCFKYGVTTNYVLGLEAILANGQRVRFGGPALDAPGYDLHGLICGSEGTLALVTTVLVRLRKQPPAVQAMTVTFDSVAQAGEAVSEIIRAGLVPATLEMMDRRIIRIIEEYAQIGLPVDAGAMLIIEVDGYAESLEPQTEQIVDIVETHGGYDVRIAHTPEERAQLWRARKSVAGAMARLAPSYYLVDVTVPRSRLAQTLTEIDEICDRYGVQSGHVLHAGDGNLHPLLLIMDPSDEEQVATVHRAGREVAELSVQKGGSLTGEHGIGTEKRKYMTLMFTEAELAAMLDVKQVFDPDNRLNPGKVLPTDVPAPAVAHSAVALPDDLFSPTTAEEAAAGLAGLSDAGRYVYVGDRAAALGQKPGTVLSTARLAGVRSYVPEDLYVTVGAGTPMSELQSFLVADDKYVPLASPWPEATVGGIVAANINGPLRLRYGSIRDVVLCATAVLADGRIIRTGRPLVKNVAGYDLTKVFVGSYGTLGVLADVTLRLVPEPAARDTLIVPVPDLRAGLTWVEQLLPTTLVASATILTTADAISTVSEYPLRLVYTAEGRPEDVAAELDQVRTTLAEAGAPTPTGVEHPSGTELWTDLLSDEDGTTLRIRIGVPPQHLSEYLLSQAASLEQSAYLIDGITGHVDVVSRVDTEEDAIRWLTPLRRAARQYDGFATVLAAPAAWTTLDRWGYTPDTLELMQALKTRWDTAGILNPDVFVL